MNTRNPGTKKNSKRCNKNGPTRPGWNLITNSPSGDVVGRKSRTSWNCGPINPRASAPGFLPLVSGSLGAFASSVPRGEPGWRLRASLVPLAVPGREGEVRAAPARSRERAPVSSAARSGLVSTGAFSPGLARRGHWSPAAARSREPLGAAGDLPPRPDSQLILACGLCWLP